MPNRAEFAVKTGRFSQQYIAIYSAALHFIWLGLEWRCDLFCQVWSYLHGLLNIVMTSTKSSSMIISSWYQIKLKARNSLISMCTLWKPSSTHLVAPDCIPYMTSLTLVIWCIRPQAPTVSCYLHSWEHQPRWSCHLEEDLLMKSGEHLLDTIFFGRKSCNIHYDWDRDAIQPTNEFIKGKTQQMLSHDSNTTNDTGVLKHTNKLYLFFGHRVYGMQTYFNTKFWQ